MYYTVYKTINNINGKFYIGFHVTDNPWDDYLGSGKLLKRAVKKYGRTSFTKSILYIGMNKRLALDKETEFVGWCYFNNDKCYNQTVGGGAGSSHKHTEEFKQRMRQMRLGKSSGMKGKPSHNKGKPMSDVAKAKLSLALTGVKRLPFSKDTRKKMCIASKARAILPITDETRAKMRNSQRIRHERGL